jgi:hypothetical protein
MYQRKFSGVTPRIAQQIDHRPGEKGQEQVPAIAGDTGFASSAKLYLTSRRPLFCFRRVVADQLQFTPAMKRLFTLTMLVSVAMICSCQKQSSTAEQQLAQRKTELDAREKALDEREKALAERERATVQSVPDAQLRRQVRDATQLKADRDRRLQQLPPEVRQLIPDAAQVKANRDARIQERFAQRQQRLQELEKTRPSRPATFPGAEAPSSPSLGAPPATEATSPPSLPVYPQAEASSPSPSPTPQ